MGPVEVRPIPAAETRPLRRAVLRPHQAAEELVYGGDDDPETLHVGAFAGGALVGVASICREPPPGETDPAAWRLRGMATLPEHRRHGLGAALLCACVAHATRLGGARLWCNARVGAVAFYRAQGLEARGGPFEIPGIGPHYFMWRRIGA